MAGKSSRRWLKEHFSDPYVKQAQQAGYRSRAVYKLLEIQKRDKLFRPGMLVVDLGAAPGGWAQVVMKLIEPNGRLIAMDILPMDPIPGVEFLQGDFGDEEVAKKLSQMLNHKKMDWVISDMAPNMSGNASIDMPRAMYLAECALEFALNNLKNNGGFLIKLFQGEGFDSFFATLKQHFRSVAIRKPKASRDRSREIYLLARELKPKLTT